MEQYSTNLTDKQWQFIEKIVNTQKRRQKIFCGQIIIYQLSIFNFPILYFSFSTADNC